MERIVKSHLVRYPLINDRFDNLPADFQEADSLVVAFAFGE